jgi:hypothetical protein
MVLLPCNPSTLEVRQEHEELKANLAYTDNVSKTTEKISAWYNLKK